MDDWSSLFIITFQFLNLAIAEWNPNTALILVNKHSETPKFPSEVSIPAAINFRMYFDSQLRYPEIATTYCPLPNRVAYCNYLRSSADIYQYVPGNPNPLREICEIPVVYSMEQYPDSLNQFQCNHDEKLGFRYRFIYMICDPHTDAQYRIPIYEICYQDNTQILQIIMGSYVVENPHLLRNDLLIDERNSEFDYYSPPNHHSRMDYLIELYEQNQTYLQRAVVPPELLPFAHEKRPLYHFTNSAPMYYLLKAGWELFMKNLRDIVSKLSYKIHVMGGLLDVLQRTNTEWRVLGYHQNEVPMIPIPKNFWVMIHNIKFTRGIAIFMRNELYSVDGGVSNMDVHDDARCSVELCYFAHLGVAMLNRNHFPNNFIYCCITTAMTRKFGVNSNHNASLFIFPNEQT